MQTAELACRRVQLKTASQQMIETQMFSKYQGSKKNHLYSTAPPSLYKHSEVESTRGLFNDQSCVMKFSLQNPQVSRLPGRGKRPGRKSDLFHRVIIFQPLKLLPVLKKREMRMIASKRCKKGPVSSCDIPAPGSPAMPSACTTPGAGAWPTGSGRGGGGGESTEAASVSKQREKCTGA